MFDGQKEDWKTRVQSPWTSEGNGAGAAWGSWSNYQDYLRPSDRIWGYPSYRLNLIGFRCVVCELVSLKSGNLKI